MLLTMLQEVKGIKRAAEVFSHIEQNLLIEGEERTASFLLLFFFLVEL